MGCRRKGKPHRAAGQDELALVFNRIYFDRFAKSLFFIEHTPTPLKRGI